MSLTEQIVASVDSAKENAELIGKEFNAAYLAYWVGRSEKYAAQMVQVWEGCQISNARSDWLLTLERQER